jgi:hypothetical protein
VAVMRPKRRAGGYKGALASPIIWPSPPTFEGAVTEKTVTEFWKKQARHRRKAETAIRQKHLEKLSLLFDHFSIKNKNDMRALVWALALKHVRGFQIVADSKPRRGRKLEWDIERLFALLQAVREAKTLGDLKDKNALWFIATNEQFAATWGFPSDRKSQSQKQQWIETLQSRLHDAKRLQKIVTEGEHEARATLEAAISDVSKKFRKK